MRLAPALLQPMFRAALCLALAGLCAGSAQAQTPPPAPAPVPHAVARESEVKAAYLYKFASFVEWPPAVFPAADTPLVIGVAGDDAVAADLAQLLAGRSLDGRPVLARQVIDPKNTSGVHILLLGTMPEAKLHEYLPPPDAPVLVVAEQEGGLRLGAALNLAADGGRVRFSAAPAQAQARGLKLSSRLLAVAQNIEGRAP
ncbi:MAG: YfiR family protein [Pseudomonadota bacterium]